MDANLYLETFRLREAELARDVELRRRAAERREQSGGDGRQPARRELRRPLRRWLGAAAARRRTA
jgi:hypothetical protein